MSARRFAAAFVVVGLALTPAAGRAAARPPATWDDLVLVESKRLDAVYLLPGADFRAYTKVMLDPTEVAFRKNWVREYNSTTSLGRITDAEAQKALETVRTGFGDIFAKAYRDAGYEVVQTAGPEVLRVRTAVINLSVSAPERPTAGRSLTFAGEAGQATLVLEARDSTSGAILGRAIDHRMAGENSRLLRNSMTNRSDFARLFRTWAELSVKGLAELKARSPVAAAAPGR